MNAHTFPLLSPAEEAATKLQRMQIAPAAPAFVSVSFELPVLHIEDMDPRKQIEQDARVGFSRGAWR